MMSAHVTSHADDGGGGGGRRSDSVASNGQARAGRWHSAEQKIERHIPRLIFDPDSGLVCYWTAIVAAATLYNAWMTALRIAFPETRQNAAASGPSYLAYLDLLSDFIYLMDIVVQLRTAYLQDGIPVFDPSKIRHQYISQPHFVRDLISVLPSQTLLSFLPDSVGCCKFFLCTAGAARLTRLLKFHILYKFYDLAESLTSNPHLIRVLRLFLNLAVIIHWIACLYYLLSEFEGLGSNEWVYTNATDQQRFTRKYIVCLYWSTMTLTTIGNTNSPETDIEYIFTGVTFMTGVFVFATVMGNVGDVISSMNANRQEFQARMDHIKMYLTHKKVPASLQLKIKKWAEYTWSRTKATDESRLLNMLPERLRAEVAVHVHLDSLKKVKIFEQCETGFLCELVLKLRSQVFSPGDYVCRAGETGREMFIINHGKVEVLVPSSATNKDMVVAALSEGNYFGEISLLRLDGVQNRRTADVRSIGYSELLCLSRRDLMSALVEYPEAKSVLESQAKKRMRTNLQAQRAFSVDTLLRSSQDQSSVDSGTAGRDEGRGHDVSEIKAMIEDLKNANKVPGRTVWQLIARCEVLQAKLSEKEKEIDDSKQRVKDLEDLLVARHSLSNESPRPPTTPISCDHQVDVDRHLLRPGTKVTKQFSQDEGRHVTSDHAVETPEQRRHQACNENMVIPDVQVTGPPPPAKCVSNGKDSNSPNCRALDEDNFIRTSKITHISYDHQDAPSRLFERDDQRESMASALRCGDGSVRIRSQNIVKTGSGYHESSYHQKITLKNFEELSFMTSFDEEFSISDSYDVETIPEEDEDAADEAVGSSENSLVTSNNPSPRTTVEYNEQNKLAQCGASSPPSATPGSNVNKLTKTVINAFDPHSKVSSQYEIHRLLSKRSAVSSSSNMGPNHGEFKEPSQKSVLDVNKATDALKDATARSEAKCDQFSSRSLAETRDTNAKLKSSVSVSDKLADWDCQCSPSRGLAPETTGARRSGQRRALSGGESDRAPDLPALDRLCRSLERMSAPDELDEGIGFLGMGCLGGRLSRDSPPPGWGGDSEDETDPDDSAAND